MTPAARFDLPPREALDFFRGKGLETSFAWQDVWQSEHDTAFVVAKMQDLDLLADVKDSVDRAIADGRTLAQFRAELTPVLQRAGWWGVQEQTDPLTGETRPVQLGSPRRLETIFRTNMQTAYAAGDWAQIQSHKESAPFLMYDAVDDNRTRPQHHAWDGIVLPVDDPWWETHRPPNGWGCRCSVIQIGQRELKRMGKSGPDTAPPIKRREWTNKRTGEVMQVPEGIDPGWAYNPGAVPRPRVVASTLLERISGVPAPLGAAAYARVMPTALPAIRANWTAWIDDVLSTRAGRPRREHQIAGVLAPEDLSALRAEGIAPISAEIAVSDQLVVGRKAARHEAAKDAMTAEDWRALPDLLAAPQAVLWDTQTQGLLHIGAGGTRRSKIAVQPGFVLDKAKAAVNSVRTAFRVDISALRGERRYRLVRGSLE